MEMAEVEEILGRYEGEPGDLIPVLQDVQERYHYLPEEVLRYISGRLHVPLSQIYHVATFYNAFSLEPRGEHTIEVCTGTACHVKGAGRILDWLRVELGIEPGQTTSDLKFTLQTVRCLGCCSLAPVVRIDGDTYGNLTQDMLPKILRRYDGGRI